MTDVYNPAAPKKSTSLTINSDLLEQAKKLKINISSILENALSETVKQKKRELWIDANEQAIEEYNKNIVETGLFSDGLRTF